MEQRFGSALNANIHLHRIHPCIRPLRGKLRLCKSAVLPICHILFLDGVYVARDNGTPRFHRVKAPERSELATLVQPISQRVGRGLLQREAETAWLDLQPPADDDAMSHLLGSAATYRIAVGPQQGRKAFMLRNATGDCAGITTTILRKDAADEKTLACGRLCPWTTRRGKHRNRTRLQGFPGRLEGGSNSSESRLSAKTDQCPDSPKRHDFREKGLS